MTREERKRQTFINSIEKNKKITLCYIIKGGYYYRERSSGYTEYKTKAGVYSKEEAIKICRACSIELPIPIDINKHNQLILAEISELSKRLIYETK